MLPILFQGARQNQLTAGPECGSTMSKKEEKDGSRTDSPAAGQGIEDASMTSSTPGSSSTQIQSSQSPTHSHVPTLDEPLPYYRDVLDYIDKLPIVAIPPRDIGKDSTLRWSDRDHDSGTHVEELSEQLNELRVLSPLIVLQLSDCDGLVIASGKKRLLAAIKSGYDTIPCKRIVLTNLYSLLPSTWSDEVKKQIIFEIMQTIVYSESAHTSPVSDESIYSMFKNMKETYNFKAKDFSKVRSRFGLKTNSPSYRNLLRIWRVVCNQHASRMVDRGWIRVGLIKADHNLLPLEIPRKAAIIENLIRIYLDDLKKRQDERDRERLPIEYQEYSDRYVENLIREVNLNRVSDEGKDLVDRYHEPKFDCVIDDGVVEIPVTKLDLNNRSPNNVRKVVEHLYKLKKVVDYLDSFVGSNTPQESGGAFRDYRPGDTPITYGETYYNFIKDKKLERYTNVVKIDEYLSKKESGPLVSEEDLKALKKKHEKQERLLDAFIDYARKEAAAEAARRKQARWQNDHNEIRVVRDQKAK